MMHALKALEHRQNYPLERASTYDLLGCIVLAKGDLEAARNHLKRALTLRSKHLTPHNPYHPDIGVSYENLAEIASRSSDLTNAQRYYEDAATIFAHNYPSSHPTVVRIRTNLAGVKKRLKWPFEFAFISIWCIFLVRFTEVFPSNWGIGYTEIDDYESALLFATINISDELVEEAIEIERTILGLLLLRETWCWNTTENLFSFENLSHVKKQKLRQLFAFFDIQERDSRRLVDLCVSLWNDRGQRKPDWSVQNHSLSIAAFFDHRHLVERRWSRLAVPKTRREHP